MSRLTRRGPAPPTPLEADDAPSVPWCMVGAGGHARAVADVLRRAGRAVGCVSDPRVRWPEDGVLALDSEDAAFGWAAAHGAPLVVAVGDNSARLRIAGAASLRGLAMPPVVASSATVSSLAALGAGAVVMEHAHVGPGSTLGTGVLVNTGAIVEHDCSVADGSHLAPGAVMLGDSHVGERAFVGARSVILPTHRVGRDATVGAGAVVTSDVPPHWTVVGVPAKPVRHSGDE